MDNVIFIEVEQSDGLTKTFAIIDRGNNEFTSMPKTTYDEMIARNEASPL